MYMPAEEKFPTIAKRNISVGLIYDSVQKKYSIDNDTIYNTPIYTTIYVYQHRYSCQLSFNEMMSLFGMTNSKSTFARFTEYILTAGCPYEYIIDFEYDKNKKAVIYSIGISFFVVSDEVKRCSQKDKLITMTVNVPLSGCVSLGDGISVSSSTTSIEKSVECTLKYCGKSVIIISDDVTQCSYLGNSQNDLSF